MSRERKPVTVGSLARSLVACVLQTFRRRPVGRRANLPKRAITASVIWFAVLAIGVLIPAEDYRIALGWKPASGDSPKSGPAPAVPVIPPERAAPPEAVPAKDPVSVPKTCAVCGKAAGAGSESCDECRSYSRRNSSWPIAILIAAISYLPLNVCILTVAAAFIGGCSVNKGELKDLERMVEHYDSNQMETPEANRDRKRLNYLTESPGYSALRGIVVYLIIISGLLLAGGSPLIEESDQTDQLLQYFKLAGIFSFFGYLAGSDPTIFSSMIEFGSARLRPQIPASGGGGPQGVAGAAQQQSVVTSTRKTVAEAKEALEAARKAFEEAKKLAATPPANDE